MSAVFEDDFGRKLIEERRATLRRLLNDEIRWADRLNAEDYKAISKILEDYEFFLRTFNK